MSYRYVGFFLTTWTQFLHEPTIQKSLNWKDYSWSSNVNMTPLLNFFPTQQPFPHTGVVLESLPGQPSFLKVVSNKVAMEDVNAAQHGSKSEA